MAFHRRIALGLRTIYLPFKTSFGILIGKYFLFQTKLLVCEFVQVKSKIINVIIELKDYLLISFEYISIYKCILYK